MKIEVSEMRIASLFLIFLAALSYSGLPQEHPNQLENPDGGVTLLERIYHGRWALGFVVVPGCPACEEFIQWFSHAAQTFPKIQFLLVAPEATPELEDYVEAHTSGVELLKRGSLLGVMLGVKRAPTLVLLVDGIVVDRLEWPFAEEELRETLTRFLAVKPVSPRELVGKVAPDFSAMDLAGKEVRLSDFPRPLFLMFFSPGCPRCSESLSFLSELASSVQVVLVVMARDSGLSVADRERLECFMEENVDRPVAVLLTSGVQALEGYKLRWVPTYILIDGKEVIARVWEGPLGPSQTLEVLEAVHGLKVKRR